MKQTEWLINEDDNNFFIYVIALINIGILGLMFLLS